MESQTVTLEHKTFVPINEYANREGISRRTANRYAKIGKIQTAKHKGRTMVIDKPIEPEPITPEKDNQESQTGQQSGQIELFGQQQWFELGKLTIRAKSRQTWQFLAIVAFVLFVGTLAMSGWFYLECQVALEQVTTAQARLTDKTDHLTATQQQIADSGNEIKELEAELVNKQDELNTAQAESVAAVGRLQEQIAELNTELVNIAKNVPDLSSRVIEPDPNTAK